MRQLASGIAIAACAVAAQAATLEVTLTDPAGAPLEDAVAWAIPRTPSARPPRPAMIEQAGRTFRPLVTIVQAGAQVSFPNRDDTRHHVYSFSPAKVFEIKLYAGAANPPSIVFDKPGEVVLGCNIHDNMVGYVYVVDTPFFAKSGADGRARLEGLPEGEYEVRAAFYGQSAAAQPRVARLRADGNATETFALPLKPRALRTAPQ